MKNSIYLFLLALFFVVGCKDELTSTKAGDPSTAAASADPTLSVSFNHNPSVAGQSVTVTGAASEDLSGTTAKVQLYQAYDSDPEQNTNAVPVSCDYSGTITWVMVAQSSTGVGSVSYVWTPTANGQYGFRVHFVKGNSNYNNLIGDCTNLEVGDANSCEPTVTPSVEIVGSSTDANTGITYYSCTVTWSVCACDEEMTNVRLGGNAFIDPYSSAPEFDVSPDEHSDYGDHLAIAWHISSIPAGECVTRTAQYLFSTNDGSLTEEWSLDFDTESQSGQHISIDPVMVQH